MLYRVTCNNKYRGLAPALFTNAEDTADYIISEAESADAEEGFDMMLDECEEWVTVCGMEYAPSVVLRRCDPVAYNCAINDWVESFHQDIVYTLEDNVNESEWFGFMVTIEEEPMQATD